MSCTRKVLLAAALLAVAALSPRRARAADACVPPSVQAALADCSAAASLPSLPAADLARPRAATPRPSTALATSRRQRPESTFDPRPFDAAEATLAAAHQRFACEHTAPAADAAARDQLAEIAFRRARLHFDARHFQEAAVLFRALALRGTETPVGRYAAQLYLESVNVLGMRGAEACYDDMARDVPAFLGLFCKDGREKGNEDLCEILGRLQRDVQRLAAEREITLAERAERGREEHYLAGAERFMVIWWEHGEAACEAKQPGCERMDEILYNAARAYQAAHVFSKAIAVRQTLVNPRYHLQGTEPARKALYEIGGAYQAVAAYDEAATWYERYARTFPASEKAPEALQDAVVLRLGLGQEDRAIEDAELFAKSYGSAKPALTAQIAFAIAAHHVEHEDWGEAKKRLTGAMPLIDRNATLDVQIQAHALLGRVHAKLDRASSAAAEYDVVRSLWKDPAAAVWKIQKQTGDDRRLAKALTALGEARFFFAEEKRRAAEAVRLPAYTGSGRREDIAAYAIRKLSPAMAARREAIADAEKEYVAVLTIQPMPPPRWVVAAAAHVARMRSLFAAEIRALPAPKTWKQHGASPWGPRWEEVRAAWIEALDAAGEPERLTAKAAARACLDLSAKFRYFDAYARSCAAWLERNYPAEYPRVDEIADRPTHRAFGHDERLAPEADPRPATSPPGAPSP